MCNFAQHYGLFVEENFKMAGWSVILLHTKKKHEAEFFKNHPYEQIIINSKSFHFSHLVSIPQKGYHCAVRYIPEEPDQLRALPYLSEFSTSRLLIRSCRDT